MIQNRDYLKDIPFLMELTREQEQGLKIEIKRFMLKLCH